MIQSLLRCPSTSSTRNKLVRGTPEWQKGKQLQEHQEEFRLQLASDVSSRDGLGLELVRENREVAAEVFRHDDLGIRTFSAFEENLPVAAIEWLLEQARERL